MSFVLPRTLVQIFTSTLLFVGFQSHAQDAGDAKAGAQKVAMCQGCHGIDTLRTAYPEVYKVPKIAGQHPKYLVTALKAYKSGERSHETMRAIAAQLSDKDMNNLAAYYASTDSAHSKK
ncbi:MAG: hypothetical protein RLZZ502_415 [Pseudomonadota bacterium]|jgi:cytochrome c553